MSAIPPIATELLRRSEITLRVNSRLHRVQQSRGYHYRHINVGKDQKNGGRSAGIGNVFKYTLAHATCVNRHHRAPSLLDP
jgi:hypothetical protein